MVKIVDCINKPIKSFANSRIMEKVYTHYRKNDGKYIAALSVGALVAKDAYGCAVYVIQNQRNKSIPEDKRKFLSALDLINGSFMVLSQLLAYATIAKKTTQSKIFNKVLGKYFTPQKEAQIEKKVCSKMPEITKAEFKKAFEHKKETTEVAFTHLFSLVTTAILAKRVIVPFIATPLADRLQKWFESNPNK